MQGQERVSAVLLVSNYQQEPLCYMRLAPLRRDMDKKELLEKAGGVTALAKLLGIRPAAIYQWDAIPQARIWQLKAMKPEWFAVENNDV